MGRGELGLVFVVVNVVVVNDVALRRQTGLTGADDQTHHHISQLLADVLNQAQTRIIGLHHHIHQRYSNIGVFCQHITRFIGRRRLQDLQIAVSKAKSLEVEARELAHIRLIIDDQQLPGMAGAVQILGRWQRLTAGTNQFHGLASSLVSTRTAGKRTSKRQPNCGCPWHSMLPPRRAVTML